MNKLHVTLLALLCCCGIAGAQRTPQVLLAGDSICTEYPEKAAPQTGWGQVLAQVLGGNVPLINFAVGGQSTKSFIDEGKWANLCEEICGGDLVLIQFGHNDEKEKETHHTDAQGSYKENLTRMIADVRERDGVPVLLTPVQRLFFRSNGEPLRTHKDYPAAMRDVAAQTGTLLIDTEELSWQWLKELGSVEAAAPYFVLDKRGNTEHPDRSHLTREGALVVAGWVAEGLRAGGLWPAAR